jgi:putative FmdB family regulatory protein
MPILKFRCAGCSKEWAKIMMDPQDAPRNCPVCGSANLEEIGPAFSYEGKSLERLMSVNCGTCGEEGFCGPVPSS